MTDDLQEWEVCTLKEERTGGISSLTPEQFHRKKKGQNSKECNPRSSYRIFFPLRNKGINPFKMFPTFAEALKTTVHLNSYMFFSREKNP